MFVASAVAMFLVLLLLPGSLLSPTQRLIVRVERSVQQ